jgi:osmoprotectant transport system ATP-binding protein
MTSLVPHLGHFHTPVRYTLWRVVSLSDVTKSYAGKRVLSPTTLAVERGACLALIGPSGCGKSTLLRVVIGLVVPDAGTVRVGDVVVSDASVYDVRLRVGYVIQDGGLFPHLSCEENVALVARRRGWAPERVTKRVDELAELARLPRETLGRFPAQLSGGQRQRVGIMRALMLDPEVLLFDEPLGALDPMVRAQLQDDLKQIFGNLGKTVLLVTHDMAEAARFGNSIALMKDGAIVQRGTIKELLEAPADPFVREFLQAQRGLSLDEVAP